MDRCFARHMPMVPMKDEGCTAYPDVLPLFHLPWMRGAASFALYQIALGFIRGNRGRIAPTVFCDHGVEVSCSGRPPRLPFPFWKSPQFRNYTAKGSNTPGSFGRCHT